MDYILNIQQLKDWLTIQDPGYLVGQRCTSMNCPLKNYIATLNSRITSIVFLKDSVVGYFSGPSFGSGPCPAISDDAGSRSKIFGLVKAIDASGPPYLGVPAAAMLTILNSIYP